ncbi:hypothetical protein, partial [Paenibacillus sp.]|uniref:hypothetical protein n=1 Tax=Paenibacillus sp. TaxID=58172 RepID=UPI003565CEC0
KNHSILLRVYFVMPFFLTQSDFPSKEFPITANQGLDILPLDFRDQVRFIRPAAGFAGVVHVFILGEARRGENGPKAVFEASLQAGNPSALDGVS